MDFIDDPEGLPEDLSDAWVGFFGNHAGRHGNLPDVLQG
jgi:hypothetical protein